MHAPKGRRRLCRKTGEASKEEASKGASALVLQALDDTPDLVEGSLRDFEERLLNMLTVMDNQLALQHRTDSAHIREYAQHH